MTNSILLPAIRSYIGDWIFYTTTLTFNEVANLIKAPDEIHERLKLSDWIQREAIQSHSDAIAKYIIENKQRFLGTLIIGVHDGNPNWSPVNVDFLPNHLNIRIEQKNKIKGKLGLLHLSGNEKLFPIDGQHRVEGIKKALSESDIDEDIIGDSVGAIFVAHDASSDKGKQRTRRLFTTVNKKAKHISPSAIIALDEDNGFAIVTRSLIDSHWLFEDERKHISYTSTGSIVADNETVITSVVGLHIIIKDLHKNQGKKYFESERPTDDELDQYLSFCCTYLDTLLEKVDEYIEVFVKGIKKANYYRSLKNNHMLFRPIGQRAFTRAVQLLISRGKDLKQSVDTLLKVNMRINSKEWHNILWDPINKSMITNKLILAETQLLTLAGEEARVKRNQDKLIEFLASF